MDDEIPPVGPLGITIRRQGLSPRLIHQLDQQLRTHHEHFAPTKPLYPDWMSYASQRHVHDIIVDDRHDRIWLATWGGILCWMPGDDRCIRHTSEHGLAGNATRSIAVDAAGLVWAAGQEGSLACLMPETDPVWRLYSNLGSWTVLRLVPRPQGGVYAALRDAQGTCAFCEIASPDARLRLTVRGGLASKDVEAMLVDDEGCLWVGNAWGLHRYKSDCPVDFFDLDGKQVRALAASVGGGLWVGTNQGIFRFRADQGGLQPPAVDWPRDEVMSVTVESDTGNLWVATTREVGRIVNNVWQPVRKNPPGRLNALVAARLNVKGQSPSLSTRFVEGRILAGGANGLYNVGVDGCESILGLDSEDILSNAIHCLVASGGDVWVGTARGLYRFEAQTWYHYDLRDVRALLPGQEEGWLWVGTWRTGLQHIESNVYVPDQIFTMPIVSLAATEGTMWIATPEAVYGRSSNSQQWKAVPYPARDHSSAIVVQTICHQIVLEANSEAVVTLWVGTSVGLFRYRPSLDLSDWAPGELQRCSIHALAVDPITNHLWMGTSKGLFSEHIWQRQLEGYVRALAFDPEGTLWLGTADGLEHWSAFGQGEVFAGPPIAHFTVTESGLAAKAVTAIAIRTVGNEREVWVGSSAGVSCYRYQC